MSGTKKERNEGARKLESRLPAVSPRSNSISPTSQKSRSPASIKKATERRAHSLSPSVIMSKKSIDEITVSLTSIPKTISVHNYLHKHDDEPVKDTSPHNVHGKLTASVTAKRREIAKMRKNLVTQQHSILLQYATLREMEMRAGCAPDDAIEDLRIVNVKGWTSHDLLVLLRHDITTAPNSEIKSHLGNLSIEQMQDLLNSIPEAVVSMGAEMMSSRIELISVAKAKLRSNNFDIKNKPVVDYDQETDRLHRLLSEVTESIRTKVKQSLDLSKVPWLDRDSITKKLDALQRENMILQNKVEQFSKKEGDRNASSNPTTQIRGSFNSQSLTEELSKERAAREALKEVVSSAEGMLRVARARISTLERQLKDTKAELEAARRKHKDIEQQYRTRETCYDARSKKLIEMSKTGEVTIESLSRQRDALELRVKELREHAEAAERLAELREAEQRSRADSVQQQEKARQAAEARAAEAEARVKELEEYLHVLRQRSLKLVDIERKRCLDYVPQKETEPSDKETEIWKELQVTRVALSQAEEELRQCRADKESFLQSLSRIAQGEGDENLRNKMAVELLDREQKVVKLQRIIEEQKENEKIMEQNLARYENQLSALRLEMKKVKHYDHFNTDFPNTQLETEIMELQMQVQTLSHERLELVTAAASRALMLERHERAAELFARVTRARRELDAWLSRTEDPPIVEETEHVQVPQVLSLVCSAASDTWSALRAERSRVLRLENAVFAQSLQLERESRIRTQLERRRAILERAILGDHARGTLSTESKCALIEE